MVVKVMATAASDVTKRQLESGYAHLEFNQSNKNGGVV